LDKFLIYTATQISAQAGDFFIMKTFNWKRWVFKKAEALIKGATTPLPLKEMAFQAINFAVACGKSNPVSFAVRPLVMHQNLRLAVGLNLALFVFVTALFSPFPSFAPNTGGPIMLAVVPEGEAHLTTNPGVVSPIPKLNETQGFWLLHPGIDLATDTGTPVRPIMKGIVTKTEYNWFGYGNMIVVSHGPDFESLYAHLSKIDVKVGEQVTTDSIIGLSGSTGHSTGPHLHLEIHQDGKAIDPAPVLGLK
jgi:murein DD-endopeptidase MepM/ murein hydrolase activator NlpD